MIPLAVAAGFVLLFLAWRVWFLRDPARRVPPGDSVLAPADGFVTYVKRVTRGTVPIAVKGRNEIPLSEILGVPDLADADGTLVGTFMTAFSVHRNRAPVAGEVVLRRHVPAPRNLTMARMMARLLLRAAPYEPECDYLVENERLTIAIRNGRGTVAVTQIADKWIDRIVARVAPGDQVGRGAQYGLIRFGSQVDLFLPDSYGAEVVAKPGQYVRAGETVIAVPKVRRVRDAGPVDNDALLALLRSHPIRMEVAYVMDRAPDFFRLHRTFPGSRVLVADDGGALPAACLSLLRYEGRLGGANPPFHYITDMIRRRGRGPRGVARALVRIAVREHLATEAAGIVALINEANVPALRLVESAIDLVPARRVGRFDYVELVPLRKLGAPGRFGLARDPAKARAFIDAAHARHALYRPVAGAEGEIFELRDGGRLVGAALLYDPSRVVSVRVLDFGFAARIWCEGLMFLHRVTGRFPEPPRIGAPVRALHLRYFAAEPAAEADLFRHLNDVAFARGIHALSFLRDEREPVSAPGALLFRYKSVLFGAFRVDPGDAPLFFDVTLG